MLNASVCGAILPAFLTILLGFFLRSQRFPVYGFWRQAERITYVVFLTHITISKFGHYHLELGTIFRNRYVILLGYALQTAVCFVLKWVP